MDHTYEARFQNIAIRPLNHADIENLRVWRNNAENSRYLSPIEFISTEQQEEWFGRYLEETGTLTFAIEETAELGRMIGSVSLYNFREASAECGRIMVGDPLARGRGWGRMGISLCVAVAFARLSCEQVDLHVQKANLAALKTYSRIGFRTDGEYSEGGISMCHMVLAKEDFFAAHSEYRACV